MEGVAEYEIDCLVAPGTSSTKNICLSHAEVSGSTLYMMIRAPKALKTLKIFVGGLRQRDPGRYSIRHKELGRVSSSTRIHFKCLSSTCQSLNTQKVKFGGRSDGGFWAKKRRVLPAWDVVKPHAFLVERHVWLSCLLINRCFSTRFQINHSPQN